MNELKRVKMYLVFAEGFYAGWRELGMFGEAFRGKMVN
jgi:hypothetical protein